jgi:hypothetical protein
LETITAISDTPAERALMASTNVFESVSNWMLCSPMLLIQTMAFHKAIASPSCTSSCGHLYELDNLLDNGHCTCREIKLFQVGKHPLQILHIRLRTLGGTFVRHKLSQSPSTANLSSPLIFLIT